jgi:hypothetical protein
MLEETQDRISSIGISPPLIGGDQRHEESAEYPFMDYDALSDGEDEVEPDVTESTGVRHDMHCWHEQGHTVSKNLAFQYACTHSLQQKSDPLPSVDLRGKASGDAARNARAYIAATAPQQKYLDMLLKNYAPLEYAALKKSAAAGRWYTENSEGCTLGVATVWKLQVGLHLDADDYELCMIVCAGKFSGGHLYLPDLDLCLEYVLFYFLLPC